MNAEFPHIEGYTILRRAGAGSAGVVYEAERGGNGHRCALKVLHAGPAAAQHFMQEFRVLSTLRHPTLAEVHEFGFDDDGNPWFSMDWIEGDTLSPEHIRLNGAADTAVLSSVLMQLTAALDYIHSQGIVHGDLKPENIILRPSADGPVVTIMDFGLHAVTGGGSEGLSGTFEYMAPEVIRGEPQQPSSDLYALGCVMYELVALAPPFTGGEPLDILRRHLVEAPPHLSDSAFPEQVLGWIDLLLQKDPQMRCRTAFQLHQMVAAFAGAGLLIEASSANRALRLLGVPRLQEHTLAMELFDASRQQARLLCVSGPTGIGKTRFLRDISTELQIAGAAVRRTACLQGDSAFAPVLRLLNGRSVQALDEEQEHFDTLAAVFPEAFPDIHCAPLPTLSEDARLLRIFHAAASLLLVTRPCDALMFDDTHFADETTADFLEYLQTFLEANSISGVFMVTARDSEGSDEAPAAALCRTVTLQPLSAPEVEDNLRRLLGDISPSFMHLVTRQSAGIPGRIEELLAFCLEEGILEQTAHGWQVHERDNLGSVFPSSLRASLAARLRHVGGQQALLLRCIAASPVPVSLALLEHVAGLPLAELAAVIAQMKAAQLVEQSRDGLQLSHPLLSELVLGADPPPASLHEAFLEWYSASPLPDGAAVLAHHFLRSATPRNALPHLLKAAAAKEHSFDYRAADSLLREALELLRAQDSGDRFPVLEALARLGAILGHRSDQEEFLEEMLLLAAQSNSSALLAKVYLEQARYHSAAADYDRSKRSAERALSYFTETGDAHGQATCHREIGLAEYRTRPGPSVLKHYETARALYAEAGSPLDEGDILVDIGLVYYSILEDPDRALACFSEAREIFEHERFARGLTRAYGNAGAQYYSLGMYEQSLEHHSKANSLAKESGDRRLMATSYGAMGQCELALCRYSPALLHLQEELRISTEIDDRYLQELCFENLGILYLTLGRWEDALECEQSALELARQAGNTVGEAACSYDIAGVLIEKREFDEALRLLKRAEQLLEQADDVNVRVMLHYRYGQFYLQKSKYQDFNKALEQFGRMGDIADRHGFISHRILSRSYAAVSQLRLGRTAIAQDMSAEAMELLGGGAGMYGGTQDILLNHGVINRAARETSAAAESISAAYEALMANAASISDAQLYRSYLETVPVNAEIVREYAISHREDSPQALSAVREQNLRTLYEVARKINSVLDLDQLLNNIMDSALEAMNGERGMIFLIENDQLALKVSRNVERETIEDATEISLSILRDVLHGGQPIIVADAKSDKQFSSRDSVVNFNIHSLICVPMKSRDEIIGTVYVDSRSDAVRAMTFSDIDADFLEAFTNLATIAIENARLHATLKEENLYLRREVEQRFGFENIIGESRPMEKLFSETQAAIGSESSVLIYGESGTGKELIAKAIHYNGSRRDNRFVAVDCGALPDTLLESELFGYKRGAFTGAFADKPGLFEEADKGTLFLDEISNTSLAFQAKLLRVLQEGEFRRVGETATRMVNVRIICATNQDLEEEIRQSRFRQDLFYRLNVIPITVPPLRDRVSDVPLLVQHFIARHNEKSGSHVQGASNELIEFLQQMPWKGNVRELENLIHRMMAQETEGVLNTKSLPSEFTSQRRHESAASGELELSLSAPKRLGTLKDIEKEHIGFILKHTDGNKTEAAKILGLKRTTLVEKMKKLGMM